MLHEAAQITFCLRQFCLTPEVQLYDTLDSIVIFLRSHSVFPYAWRLLVWENDAVLSDVYELMLRSEDVLKCTHYDTARASHTWVRTPWETRVDMHNVCRIFQAGWGDFCFSYRIIPNHTCPVWFWLLQKLLLYNTIFPTLFQHNKTFYCPSSTNNLHSKGWLHPVGHTLS